MEHHSTNRNLKRLLLVPLMLTMTGLVIHRFGPYAQGSSERNIKVQQNKTHPVDVLTLQETPFYRVTQTYTGIVTAGQSSDLSFELSGLITAIEVDQGDTVVTGDLLATLDNQRLAALKQELVAQRTQAQAQLQQLQTGPRPEEIAQALATVNDMEAQLQLARSRNQRRQLLLSQGAISQEQYDETASGEAALIARLEAAKQQLQLLQNGTRAEQLLAQEAVVKQLDAKIANLDIDIRKSVLYAPFDGQISQKFTNEGAVITAGNPLFRLVKTTVLEAHVGVPATVATQLQIGSLQRLQIEDHIYEARLHSLLPELDPTTRTVTAILKLQTTNNILPGQIARLQVSQAINNQGFWLPTTALVSNKRGLWAVYVLKPTQDTFQLEQQDIEILHTEDSQVFVQGGLVSGEQVVADGTHRLVPSQFVYPVHLGVTH